MEKATATTTARSLRRTPGGCQPVDEDGWMLCKGCGVSDNNDAVAEVDAFLLIRGMSMRSDEAR